MLVKTLEIGWHEAKPIYSCDLQRKTIRLPNGNVAHKFATAGADTHVRLWLIHPTSSSPKGEPQGPRAEYLSTLTKHAGAVNVVRWSPNGELIASGADDGMLIIWTKDEKDKGQTGKTESVWGRDKDDVAMDKETWKVVSPIRVTSGEVYDLAWSPTSEYILTGSTDNTARIFSVATATCIREIADHAHYVQGVAWDPMNEYIATQSSDRSVKLYNVQTKNGVLEVTAIGSNSKMTLRGSRTHGHGHSRSGSTANGQGRAPSHSRAPSVTRPSPTPATTRKATGSSHVRRSSISSEASSVSMAVSYTRDVGRGREMPIFDRDIPMNEAPLTPATSTTSGFGGTFFPPSASGGGSSVVTPITPAIPRDSNITPSKELRDPSITPQRDSRTEYREPRTAATSRRSSFSGSQAPGSPASFRGRAMVDERDSRSSYGRSPSPMPPLPAIRTPHPTTGAAASSWAHNSASNWSTSRLYGDENMTSFFRRLTFSADGTLLFTPAGWFEDNSLAINTGSTKEGEEILEEKERVKAARDSKDSTSSSCVYVYSKANFSKSPVATYPGHHRATVCVKFSSILYDLRNLSSLDAGHGEPVTIPLEPGKEDIVDAFGGEYERKPSISGNRDVTISGPSRSSISLPSPALTAVDSAAHTPANSGVLPESQTSATSTGTEPVRGPISGPASVFALPYRMMFAVATQDSVAIHDTQQSTPVCLLSKLHYDSFTDMAWSNDGQLLMLVSSDGYCTVVLFDENMPLHNTQQRDLQLKSVALAHSHSLISNPSSSSHGPHSHSASSATPAASTTQTQAQSLQPTHSHTGTSTAAAIIPNSPLVHPPPSPFVPPHAPSPAVSTKDLPGPSSHTSTNAAGTGTTTGTTGGGMKRTASTFDPPTPAHSVGGDGDAAMHGGNASESEREREEGRAKKRRRVELRHHGAGDA